MDRKNPGGDRTDLYHLFVKTSRQEKKRGRAGLILRSFWNKNEIFHRVYIIDDYYVTAKNGSRFLFPADKCIFLHTEK